MNRFGTYTNPETEVTVSFELLKATAKQDIDAEKAAYELNLLPAEIMKSGEYSVALFGLFNRLPDEVKELIRNNHLLPEILKKQVRYIYGLGPSLFQVKKQGEGEKKRKKRDYFDKSEHPEVWAWLESWKENGLPDDYTTYLKKAAHEYYAMEGVFSKYLFNLSRRVNGKIPIRGLEFLKSDRCRLAKKGEHDINYPLEDEEMKYILYGRWNRGTEMLKRVYARFNEAQPLKHKVAISYVKDIGFGEEIYSIPTFYYGLKEWIKGSNLNAKYINSYLKNSLSAKIHVIIPNSWFELKEATLKKIVEKNLELQRDGKEIVTKYDGLEGIGTVFNYGMVNKLVKVKLREITNLLSGEGENQGKTFTSRSFTSDKGVEEWQFKDIPVKYSEFVKSIIEYDKRAVEVILQGKGLPPAISNVSKDGVFQSSGSDAYYNYLIYLNSLVYAEEFILQDINRALHINFPNLKAGNIKLGFEINIPARQEELPPKQRLENTSK
jgi:hypothetical protein